MKIILLYITLVGVLLAVLLGILKVGEKLQAPINVSGKWIINDDFTKAVANSCAPVTFHKDEPLLSIEQSGIYLNASFNDINKTEMSGKLENNKMVFNQVIQAKKDSAKKCGNDLLTELSITVIQNDTTDALSGTWKTPNCSKCGEIKFSAIKKQEE
jgi:hypothetical protein